LRSIADDIYSQYNGIPDEDWHTIIHRSATASQIDGITFPSVPDETVQRTYVGSTLAENTREPFQYYKAIKDIYTKSFKPIDKTTELLDVGCGWGRIIRFFMKDIAPGNLTGCDVSPQIIDTCRRCFHDSIPFQLIPSLPPTVFDNDSFDIIEGYSVFSHLSFYAVIQWLNEYFRILKPGGMLAMTVWKEDRFDYITALQHDVHKSPVTETYLHILQSSFSQNCSLERDVYRQCGFIFMPYSPDDPELTYGEAFVSPKRLEVIASGRFDFVTTYPLDVQQQIVVFRKKQSADPIGDAELKSLMSMAKLYDMLSICACAYNRRRYTQKAQHAFVNSFVGFAQRMKRRLLGVQ